MWLISHQCSTRAGLPKRTSRGSAGLWDPGNAKARPLAGARRPCAIRPYYRSPSKGVAGTTTPKGVEEPRSVGLAMADADQPSPSHGHLPLDVTGLAMGGAVRQTARRDVGLFVGLFCQRTSGFWRSVAVASRATKSAESPVNKGNPANDLMPEEGLEPPTRGL